MKAMRLSKPGGLDQLKLAGMDGAGTPGAGEILVRLHANSLNFHDYLVATGKDQNGRWPHPPVRRCWGGGSGWGRRNGVCEGRPCGLVFFSEVAGWRTNNVWLFDNAGRWN